jgi:hypothetical protein
MSRKIHEEPNYTILKNEKEISRIEKEITQFKPKTEVTIEGLSDIAVGRIFEWYPKRKFFSVKWSKLSEKFEKQTESKSGLRVFFKAHLFSTQVLFKSTTLRRLSEEETEDGSVIYHYRIPEIIYQQQRRGALRVPLSKSAATLVTPMGKFQLLDLSVTGAKLRRIPDVEPEMGKELKTVELFLGKNKISSKNFHVKFTRVASGWCAVGFTKISDLERTQIKQFLIDALRSYYAEELRTRS